jgi:hypothetical protein
MTPSKLVLIVDRCLGKYLELAEETAGGWKELHNDELDDLYLPNVRVITS